MALVSQNVDVAFEGGLDTNLDPKKVIPGKLLELENAVFTGRSIEMRPGSRALPDTTRINPPTLGDAFSIASVGRELLRWTTSGVFGQVANSVWVSRAGQLDAAPLRFDVEPITQQPRSTECFDTATSGGVTAYTWTEFRGGTQGVGSTRNLYVTVVDNATRTRHMTATLVTYDGNNADAWRIQCRALVCNGVIVLVYAVPLNSTTARVFARCVVPSSPGVLTAESALLASPPIRSGSTLPYEMDALDMSDAGAGFGRFALAVNGSNGIGVSWFNVSTAGVVTANGGTPPGITQQTTSGASGLYLSVHLKRTADGTRLFLLYHNSTSGFPELHTYRTSDMVRLAVVTLYSGASSYFRCTTIETSAGEVTFYVDMLGANVVRTCRVSSEGVLLQSLVSTWVWGVRLAGDAFALEGRNFLPVLYHDMTSSTVDQPGVQPTFFVLEASSRRVVARVLDGEAGGPFPDLGPHLPHVLTDAVGSGVASALVPRRLRPEYESTSGVVSDITAVSLAQVNLRMANPASLARVVENSTMHIGGALPIMYDGTNWVEDGFNVRPEGVKVTLKSGTTGGLSAGTYQWAVCYEWDDAQGRRHRSAPSPTVKLTVPVNSAVQLEIPTLELTRKDGVRLSIYRTLVDAQVFHRVAYSRNSYVQALSGGISTARTILLQESETDTNIADNELLPFGGGNGGTSGGEAWHVPPPAYDAIHQHGDYLFTNSMATPGAVFYSLPVDTVEGLAWANEFRMTAPSQRNPVRAFSTLDDKLITHTRSGAYFVQGQGPTRSGTDNGFSELVYITGSVGCVSWPSVLSTSAGVMYQSSSGVFLLTRSLETVKAGDAVQAYAKLTFSRALHVAERRELRFFTLEGTTLVYSEEWGQWSVWTGQPARDATLHLGGVFFADGAQVRTEDATLSTENGVAYSMVVGSSWLRWAGIAGLERVWQVILDGTAQVTTKVQTSVFYDFATTAGVTVEKTFIGSSAGGPPSLLVRHRLGKQLANALRFRWVFTPAPVASSDKGRIILSAMALEFGVAAKYAKRNMRFLGRP